MSYSSSHSTRFLALLLSLYVAQGLPVGFMTQALPVLLRHYGVSLTQIGFSGLLMLPWAIKFLWASRLDRTQLNFGQSRYLQGHYRLWVIVMQGLTLLCVLGLALIPVTSTMSNGTLTLLSVLLLLMNFCCATQDIATDALAVTGLQRQHLQWGNSVQVLGSRVGFILGGGAILLALDWLSWQNSFLLLGLGIAVNSIAIFRYNEPLYRRAEPTGAVQSSPQPYIDYSTSDASSNDLSRLKSYIHREYGYLWSTVEMKHWLWVLCTYKIADGLASPVIKPMMVDMGISLGQIGLYVSMLGTTCAGLGALAVGILIKRFSAGRMLIALALAQIITWAYYAYLAYAFEHQFHFSLWHVYIAHALEETLGTMSLVALLTIVMQHARISRPGSDFTLQVAVMTLVSGGLHLIGGLIAQALGYFIYLTVVAILAALSVIPKWYWYRRYCLHD